MIDYPQVFGLGRLDVLVYCLYVREGEFFFSNECKVLYQKVELPSLFVALIFEYVSYMDRHWTVCLVAFVYDV